VRVVDHYSYPFYRLHDHTLYILSHTWRDDADKGIEVIYCWSDQKEAARKRLDDCDTWDPLTSQIDIRNLALFQKQ
jgi:hypothetical protein